MRQKGYIVYAMGMHSSKYGGLEQFLVILTKKLAEINVGMIIIYNSLPKSKKFLEDINTAGGKIIVAHAMQPLTYFNFFLKIFRKYRPFLIHAHFQVYYSILFAKLLGCRKIYFTLHGMTIDENANNIKSTKDIAFSTRIYRKIIHSFTNQIFAVSEAVNQQYKMLFPSVSKKIKTLYLGSLPNINGRTLNKTFQELNPDRTIIATIGFNSPIKGLDVLLDAMEILLKDFLYDNFILYQIGIDPDDPENIHYIKKCYKKGITKHIRWLGIRNDVTSLLPFMDIYCQPSMSEALGLSLIEAGMAGLPLLGSRIGGIPEVILEGYNGFLFEKGNANDLAKQLMALMRDKELRIKMGRKSKEYMLKNFNLDVQVNKFSEIYLHELNHR